MRAASRRDFWAEENDLPFSDKGFYDGAGAIQIPGLTAISSVLRCHRCIATNSFSDMEILSSMRPFI